MRNSIFTIAVSATLTTMLGALNPSTASAVNSNVTTVQQRDTLGEDYVEYKRKAEERIRKNEIRIAELRGKIDREKAELKAKHNAELNELETKNNKLKRKLNEYKNNTKEGWRSFRTEFSHDMEALGNSLKNFVTNNK